MSNWIEIKSRSVEKNCTNISNRRGNGSMYVCLSVICQAGAPGNALRFYMSAHQWRRRLSNPDLSELGDSPFLVTCGDYRKRHQPTPHYAWPWTLAQALNRTSGRSGSASEDDPAECGCSRSRTTLGSTPTTPGGSHMTASLGGLYDPWPVKRSTD